MNIPLREWDFNLVFAQCLIDADMHIVSYLQAVTQLTDIDTY